MLFNYRLKIRGKRVHLSRMDRQWTDNGPTMDRQWTDNGPIMSGNFGSVVVVLVVVVDVVEGLDAIGVDLRGLDDF